MPVAAHRVINAPTDPFDFQVAVIGGGPAGLSPAVTLGRACRSVALFDYDKPRNYAAQAVHCYLGRDGMSPWELRAIGRTEAACYWVEHFRCEVTGAASVALPSSGRTAFRIELRSDHFAFEPSCWPPE